MGEAAGSAGAVLAGVSPHPDCPAESQTQDPTTCASPSWVHLGNLFSRDASPTVLSSTPAPSALSNSLKRATSTQVPTENLEAALDISFSHRLPYNTHCYRTLPVLPPTSVCLLLSIPVTHTPRQATPISCWHPTFLGCLHPCTQYAIRGYFEK